MDYARSLSLVTVALVALGGAGCQMFGVSLMGDRTKEIERADQARDIVKLQQLCAELTEAQKAPNHGQSINNQQSMACRAARAHAGDEDDGNCATVVARYGKSVRHEKESHVDYGHKWGTRFAKCNNYSAIFEQLAHVGDDGQGSIGQKVLTRLEGEGLPVAAEFAKYAQDNQGPRFLAAEHSGHAANHISNWLLKQKHMGVCGVVAGALAEASDEVKAPFLIYFSDGKACMKPAMRIAVSLLTSDKPLFRRVACANLADLGDMSVVRKVTLLAETDSYSQVNEERGGDGRVWARTVYPVRDACRAAAGKIRLRAE